MFRVYGLNGSEVDDQSPADGYHSEAAAVAAATAYYNGNAMVVIHGKVIFAMPAIKQDEEFEGFSRSKPC